MASGLCQQNGAVQPEAAAWAHLETWHMTLLVRDVCLLAGVV